MLTIGRTLHVPWLSLSACTWSLFYVSFRRWEPQQKAEWHCRVVTVFHASLISLLSGWSAFVQGPWPFTDAGGPNTPLQIIVVTICLGYFLFDFSWCLYFQTEGFPMLLHHFLSIFGMFFMLVSGKYGTEMVATIFGSELTNPLLQLRWFLKETGRYKTLAGEVVDFLFMTSFFFLRIGVGSVLLYCYFQQPTDFWGRLGAICIYLIGWMFWVSIFRYALYKHGKKIRAWCDKAGMGKRSRLDRQSENDEDENSKRLKSSQSDAGSGRLSRNSLDRPAQSVSPSVSQNGTFHRNNGGQSSSKGTAHLNGSSTDKRGEQS